MKGDFSLLVLMFSGFSAKLVFSLAVERFLHKNQRLSDVCSNKEKNEPYFVVVTAINSPDVT